MLLNFIEVYFLGFFSPYLKIFSYVAFTEFTQESRNKPNRPLRPTEMPQGLSAWPQGCWSDGALVSAGAGQRGLWRGLCLSSSTHSSEIDY